jgi:uncharacterized protein (DUF362 family)
MEIKYQPTTVVVYKSKITTYPQKAPFHPKEKYHEYLFDEVGKEDNPIYESVRNCLFIGGFDKENFNNSKWNPLKGLVKPGETVLLKPNLVKEAHPRDSEGWRYVLTQGSIIRALADYVWKALEGKGKIILADGPQTDSSFSKITQLLGLNQIEDFYKSKGLDFQLIDLRKEEWISQGEVIVSRKKLNGDPSGYIAFDLGENSEFHLHKGAGRYYGADYDEKELNSHHSNGKHEYLISASSILCDVVFSLPKLKTHKKAGITVSLKNLVGINGNKNWLPHHTEGNPSNGGDEHPNPNVKHKTERAIIPYFRQLSLKVPVLGSLIHRQARKIGKYIFGDTENVIRSGNWWGNDTIWRMCLDLNKIVLYGNADGTLRLGKAENRKRHFVLVDGIIAGEGNGPMNPDPFPAGLILFGLHPASVDATAAYLMGYNPSSIPIVENAFHCKNYPLTEWHWSDINLISNIEKWNGSLTNISDTYAFKPHFGWLKKIERNVS